MIGSVENLEGVRKGGAGSGPQISGWLNWLAGELSTYYVLGVLLTTSISQLIFMAY